MKQTSGPILKNRSSSNTRCIEEIDLLKCIMIIFVIAFHLVYIGDSFPYAKSFVYTFHMPIFLMISGFLMKADEPVVKFVRRIIFYAIPYFVMESGYIIMASMLPIREHIEELSMLLFLDKLMLHPLGPYWYLHTLIICGVISFCILRLSTLRLYTKFVIIGIAFYLLHQLGLISFSVAIYYLIGIIIRYSHTDIFLLFQPSFPSLIALLLLALYPANLVSASIGSLLIVCMTISFCLTVFSYIKGNLRHHMMFIGRNTLPLYLFSPIFTILCKGMVNYLAFDSSRMIFLILSLAICISGSLAINLAMDWCGVSLYFFGRNKSLR